MKLFLLMTIGSLCWAGSEPGVTLDSLKRVENSINDKFSSDINEPYDLMGPARGTYLAGYGAVFTVYLNVITVPALMVSPFNPKPTEAALMRLHDRKVRKLITLRETLRDLISGASQSMPGLAADDHVVMEAFLFDWSWEITTGIPHRITVTASRQKLQEALSRHAAPAEMAILFEERVL